METVEVKMKRWQEAEKMLSLCRKQVHELRCRGTTINAERLREMVGASHALCRKHMLDYINARHGTRGYDPNLPVVGLLLLPERTKL